MHIEEETKMSESELVTVEQAKTIRSQRALNRRRFLTARKNRGNLLPSKQFHPTTELNETYSTHYSVTAFDSSQNDERRRRQGWFYEPALSTGYIGRLLSHHTVCGSKETLEWALSLSGI